MIIQCNVLVLVMYQCNELVLLVRLLVLMGLLVQVRFMVLVFKQLPPLLPLVALGHISLMQPND